MNPFQSLDLPVTGGDFLRFLLTSDCVDPSRLPSDEQWATADFSRYGKTEAEIRHFLEEKAKASRAEEGLSGFFYADLLSRMMAQGLIYRLSNPREEGKAYYGVPVNVRQALSLSWQAKPSMPSTSLSEMPGAKDGRDVFIGHLKRFLESSVALGHSEILEYAAQICLNAIEQGDLQPVDAPASLLQTAQTLGLVAVPHYAGLTVLLEACLDTPLFKPARALCDCAVDVHLLPAEDVDDVLAKAPGTNPFMVLG